MPDPAGIVQFITAQLDAEQFAAEAAKRDPDGRTYDGDPDDGHWTAYPHAAGHYDSDRRPFWLVGTEVAGTWQGWTISETGRHAASGVYAERIARHDPARVLAEVAAKRRILERHAGFDFPCNPDDGPGDYAWTPSCDCCHEPWPCPDVRDVAAPYADRKGRKDEWAVAAP